jgi:hypothetical protein
MLHAFPDWLASTLLTATAAACCCAFAIAADPAGFSGKLAIELIDEVDHNHRFRLLQDFGFIDAQGRHWVAPAGSVVDDESVPRELRTLAGLPYLAEYRKAAIVHRHFSATRSASWRVVQRMLFEASLAEGVSVPEARVLYATVRAGGWRWEPAGSSCYRSCHAAAASLAWKPRVMAADIQPVLEWAARSDGGLDEIDARLDTAIKRPGPHLFAQPAGE